MTQILCSGYLCTACYHPKSNHSELGCSELLDVRDDGYPNVCDCRRHGWDEPINDAPARARDGEGGG